MKYLTAEQVLFIPARLNDYRLTANNQQLVAFTLQCAQHLVSLDQMTLWFESQSESVP